MNSQKNGLLRLFANGGPGVPCRQSQETDELLKNLAVFGDQPPAAADGLLASMAFKNPFDNVSFLSMPLPETEDKLKALVVAQDEEVKQKEDQELAEISKQFEAIGLKELNSLKVNNEDGQPLSDFDDFPAVDFDEEEMDEELASDKILSLQDPDKKMNQMQTLNRHSITKKSQLLKITAHHVLSASGLNVLKQIVVKHLELMCVCQSHSFDIFVSLTNQMRCFTYLVANLLLTEGQYKLLMNDPTIYYVPIKDENNSRWASVNERSRVARSIAFQEEAASLKQDIIDMQSFVETAKLSLGGTLQGEDLGANFANLCTFFNTSPGPSLRSGSGQQPLSSANNLLKLQKTISMIERILLQKASGLSDADLAEFIRGELAEAGEPGRSQKEVLMQVIVQSITALQQVEFLAQALGTEGPGELKDVVRQRIGGSTEHRAFMLSFFQKWEAVRNELGKLVIENNLKFLLLVGPCLDINPEPPISSKDLNQRRQQEFDRILADQFFQVGKELSEVLANIKYACPWATMPNLKAEPSSYTGKIIDKVKQFEFKMKRVCDHFRFPKLILLQHLFRLWDMISFELQEQFSLVLDANANARKTMIADTEWLVQAFTKRMREELDQGEHAFEEIALSKQEKGSIIPSRMKALQAYLGTYFIELPQLLQFTKNALPRDVTLAQLYRLFRVHPILRGDTQPGGSSAVNKPGESQSMFDWFKKEEKPKRTVSQPVKDFYSNVDLYLDILFSRTQVRQQSVLEQASPLISVLKEAKQVIDEREFAAAVGGHGENTHLNFWEHPIALASPLVGESEFTYLGSLDIEDRAVIIQDLSLKTYFH